MRYHSSTRMAKIKNLTMPRVGENVEQLELLYSNGGSLNLQDLFGKLYT